MALRVPFAHAAHRATWTVASEHAVSVSRVQWRRGNATVAPVAQPKTGSKGPTAMVFMNMGGPSTTDEVHGFLSMLFVRPCYTLVIVFTTDKHRPTKT